MLKEQVLRLFESALTHPFHAHVHSSYEDDEPIVTGFGKTKAESKRSSLHSHRINIHGYGVAEKYYKDEKVDKEDDEDRMAGDLHKQDDHYKMSEKAHDHVNHMLKNHDGSEHDGYELHGKNIRDLHFDHKNKTISHVSEVK